MNDQNPSTNSVEDDRPIDQIADEGPPMEVMARLMRLGVPADAIQTFPSSEPDTQGIAMSLNRDQLISVLTGLGVPLPDFLDTGDEAEEPEDDIPEWLQNLSGDEARAKVLEQGERIWDMASDMVRWLLRDDGANPPPWSALTVDQQEQFSISTGPALAHMAHEVIGLMRERGEMK
jgi:hypothetical protein